MVTSTGLEPVTSRLGIGGLMAIHAKKECN